MSSMHRINPRSKPRITFEFEFNTAVDCALILETVWPSCFDGSLDDFHRLVGKAKKAKLIIFVEGK